MSKHTVGPWVPAVYNATETIIQRLRERPQASVCTNYEKDSPKEMLVALCGDADDPQSVADARLIAAAPEMLELIKCILKEWEAPTDGVQRGELIARLSQYSLEARNIVSKVEGK